MQPDPALEAKDDCLLSIELIVFIVFTLGQIGDFNIYWKHCTGHTTIKIFAYLKFTFNWASCVLSDSHGKAIYSRMMTFSSGSMKRVFAIQMAAEYGI